jgi:hypothetical protein
MCVCSLLCLGMLFRARGYKRLGETRILHLQYLIMFCKTLLCKPDSEGSRLSTAHARTYTTIRRLIAEL